MKEMCFIGAARRSRACARSPQLIRGLTRQFVLATISGINDSRNFVNADIDVPAGGRPALLTFSRPYFRGYKARIGDQKLAITSYRGLFPIVGSSSRHTWAAYGCVSTSLAAVGRGYGCRLRLYRPARRCRRLALLFFD